MNFLKRYLPQIAAIILFAVITAMFFSPIFDDKQVYQSDIYHYLGGAKEIKDFREKTGKEPLWTNSMFGGMPAYQISVKYPANKVTKLQELFQDIMPFPATVILISIIGFYFLLVTLKVDKWVSIAGAIAFGLSSFIVIVLQAGHNTQAYAIAYMPAVLTGVFLAMRGRLWLGAALTSLALALELNANHLQMTYYLMILVLFVVLGEAIRLILEKKVNYLLKAAGLLLAGGLVAALPNLGNLMLTNEYSKDTTRGPSELTIDKDQNEKTGGLPFDYATQWSYGVGETMTLMIPDFNGGASEPLMSYDQDAFESVDANPKVMKFVGERVNSYFGNVSFTSGPVYVGAIICFLFILGLFIVKDNIKWYLLGATVLSIILAWGSNAPGISKFFFYHIPGYNKFRSVEFILIIAEVAIPLLAFLAVREIIKNPGVIREKMVMFYVAFGVTAGICLLVWLAPSLFTSPMSKLNQQRIEQRIQGYGQKYGVSMADKDEVEDAAKQARLGVVKSDAGRSFFLILFAAVLLFFFIRSPFNTLWLAGGLTLLMLVDMYGVSSRYMSEEKGHYEPKKENPQPYEYYEADRMIDQDKDPDYRVLNLAVDPWQDASTSYWHKSIGGYHGAKLKRIQELFEQNMQEELNGINGLLQQELSDSAGVGMFIRTGTTPGLEMGMTRFPSINMLNTRYIIFNPKGGVFRNSHACGNAWFVNKIQWVKNADEEIVKVKTFDPKAVAVIDERFQSQIPEFTPKFDPAGTIKLTSYAPNELKYESDASSDQLAVFSEIYYDGGKGWNVYVDGKPAQHMRADYVLRAMRVPAGKHVIDFKFEPKAYYTGEKIAGTGSILLLLFFAGGIYMEFRKKKDKAKQAA